MRSAQRVLPAGACAIYSLPRTPTSALDIKMLLSITVDGMLRWLKPNECTEPTAPGIQSVTSGREPQSQVAESLPQRCTQDAAFGPPLPAATPGPGSSTLSPLRFFRCSAPARTERRGEVRVREGTPWVPGDIGEPNAALTLSTVSPDYSLTHYSVGTS